MKDSKKTGRIGNIMHNGIEGPEHSNACVFLLVLLSSWSLNQLKEKRENLSQYSTVA